MTQVDKFAPRKYLSSLKLVFASDTRFTHFVLFFYLAPDFCHQTLNKSGLCLSHYDLNKKKQDSEIWNNFIEDHLTVGCLGRSENKIIYGKGQATKSYEFSEKCQRGGGSFSIPKFILQILGTLNKAF